MTDLERRVVALEREVRSFSLVGGDLQWSAFNPPTDLVNTSKLSLEKQVQQLEKQWDNCQIVGDAGVHIEGSMREGWAVSETATESSVTATTSVEEPAEVLIAEGEILEAEPESYYDVFVGAPVAFQLRRLVFSADSGIFNFAVGWGGENEAVNYIDFGGGTQLNLDSDVGLEVMCDITIPAGGYVQLNTNDIILPEPPNQVITGWNWHLYGYLL